MGDRALQVALGIPTFVVGLGLLAAPLVLLGEMPGKWQIAGGIVCTLIGLWLAVPVGIGGLMDQAADSFDSATNSDSNGSD